ncbi:MAG TPA: hypothetical protein VLV83_13190 [Acidobacteriota bacterium]|nr:hypothetical protein [Acidobacteriota bacterium]
MTRTLSRIILLVAVGLGCAALLGAEPPYKKMKPEEFLAEYHKALGSAEAVQARQSTLAQGKVTMTLVVGGDGQLIGPSTYFSKGDASGLLFHFKNPNYEQDHVVANDGEVRAAYQIPGERSPMSDYLFTQDKLMKDNLIGGALQANWPLIDLEAHKAKIRYKGIKNRDGQGQHLVEYRMHKGSGGTKIELWFDEETFYHVGSTYTTRIPAGIGSSPDESARQRDSVITVEETFSEFRNIDGINVPTQWEIRWSNERFVWSWLSEFNEISHNVDIPQELWEVKLESK